MGRLDPQEELDELNSEIAVMEHVAVRKMREVQDLIEELNQMEADREVVAQYIKDHPPKPECSVDGCAKEARARGLCSTHYKRERRANGKDHE